MKTQITQPKKRHRSRLGRKATWLRLSPELYEKMKERAAQEELPFCAWLKRAAMKELRRESSL